MFERLTENENRWMMHMIRWGSDGWPILKVKGGWIFESAFGVGGSPIVYKTKRQAGKAVMAYEDMLSAYAAGRIQR